MEALHLPDDDHEEAPLVDVLLQHGPDLGPDDAAQRAVDYCADPDIDIAVIVLNDGRTVTYDHNRPGRPATVSGTGADGTCWAFHAAPRGPLLSAADAPDLAGGPRHPCHPRSPRRRP